MATGQREAASRLRLEGTSEMVSPHLDCHRPVMPPRPVHPAEAAFSDQRPEHQALDGHIAGRHVAPHRHCLPKAMQTHCTLHPALHGRWGQPHVSMNISRAYKPLAAVTLDNVQIAVLVVLLRDSRLTVPHKACATDTMHGINQHLRMLEKASGPLLRCRILRRHDDEVILCWCVGRC
jgi:hypothetical protein